MPPKKKAAAAEAKRKIVEDKTFGLKNKNKSKKVQAYVQQVEKQATQKVEGPSKNRGSASGSGADEKATSKKALMAKRLEELSLLNQPVVEKPKKSNAEEEARRKQREEEEAERIRIANLPVEEQIEEERAKLKTRTPVTEALFLEWKRLKDEQRKKREANTLAAVQKNMSKAERARGSGLTGRQLFEQHRDIFIDDEAADDTKYEREENQWIGDRDGIAADVGNDGENSDEHAFASQINPEEDCEPPDAAGVTNDADATDVGDESLFS